MVALSTAKSRYKITGGLRWRRDERSTRKRGVGVSPYSERDLCVILRYRRRR